ncbi:MAG TPA: molybdenum cofactor biosynthesis protein MoaE [Aeromicrobium sp.]|nr:molybdenum cofactor biosynthesis protein MoaE [Aeromicrobium sp.]
MVLSPVRLAEVRATPLSLDEVFDAVRGPSVGGIVLFVGTVRDEDEGRHVTRLDYSHHPTAEEQLRAVAERIAAETQTIVAAVHRVGELDVGDLAVVVAASAGHRSDAFEAGRRLIDEIKLEVPIWKHQMFADGDAAWVSA